MKKYKVSVSKGQKKYTIIVSALSEEEAKERVHKEGYSILTTEEFDDTSLKGQKFIFQVKSFEGKEIKNGEIFGKDIFKIYLKLRDELLYDVILLYSEEDKNIEEREKLKIINSLKEQYFILKGIKSQKKEENVNKNEQEPILNQEFHLKKELEETYKLIDFVLIKLQNIINDTNIYNLDSEQKVKFQDIYNNITNIKKTTNAAKLKQIGEIALLKIGNIELKVLEKQKNEKSKELLNETNKLLKKIGSDRQFLEKDKDLKILLEFYISFFNNFIHRFSGVKNFFKSNKEKIDKSSYSYLKTIILIKKYKIKKEKNDKELEKLFLNLRFPSKEQKEKKTHLLLKKKVIKQNISLLEAKKLGKVYSYTFIKKGYTKIINIIFSYIYKLKPFIFFIIVLYTIFFISYFNLIYYSLLDKVIVNYDGVFYMLLIVLSLIFIQFSKGFFSFIFNFVIFGFIFIVGVINF